MLLACKVKHVQVSVNRYPGPWIGTCNGEGDQLTKQHTLGFR